MSDSNEVEFSVILAELLDGEKPFRPSHLFQLSQITPSSAALLEKSWQEVPLQRRRSLLEDMEAFAAQDPLLFFDRVAVIAVRDADAQVRAAAVRLISYEERSDFAAILLPVLADDAHYDVRAAAATALGKFVYLGEIDEIPAALHKQVEEGLLKAFRKDPQTIVRRRALEAIGFSSREEVNRLIEDAFDSDDEDWQASALFAMGASADQHWERSVVSMLDAESPPLRLEAARAAGKLDLKETRQTLFDMAENDDDEDVRAAAIWALTDIGGDEVAEFIEGLLEEAEAESDVSFLEEALDNLMETQMFNDPDLPLFDFADDDEDPDGENLDEKGDDGF